MFIPIYYLIRTTFKSPQEATASPLGIPKTWIFENYSNAWKQMSFPRAFGNTVFITATAVKFTVIFGSMVLYALARTKTKLGKSCFYFSLQPSIVPFQMNIVSLYTKS